MMGTLVHVQLYTFSYSKAPQHMINNRQLKKQGYLTRFCHKDAVIQKKKPPKFSPAETDPSDVSLQESCGNLSCQTPLLLMAFPSVLFPPRFNLCRNLSSMRNALTNTVGWLGLTFCFYPYGKPDPKISVFLRLA